MTKLNEMAEEYAQATVNAVETDIMDAFKAGYLTALESSEVNELFMQLRNYECATTKSFGFAKCSCSRCSALATFRKMREGVG